MPMLWPGFFGGLGSASGGGGVSAAPDPSISNVLWTHQFTNVTDSTVDYAASTSLDEITSFNSCTQDTTNTLFGANAVAIGTGAIDMEHTGTTVEQLGANANDDYVIEAWFRPTGTSQQAIISIYNGTGDARNWWIICDDDSGGRAGTPDSIVLTIYPDSADSGSAIHFVSTDTFVRNAWNYVAVMRIEGGQVSGDHYAMWLGQEGGNAVYQGAFQNTAVPGGGGNETLDIGKIGGGTPLLLSGSIGPVRITQGEDFLPRDDFACPTSMFPTS